MDLYCTKSVRTTGGSTNLVEWVPEEDETVVARLAGAGAIAIGKLNLHEFAFDPEGPNAHYGMLWHRLLGGPMSACYERLLVKPLRWLLPAP